MSFACAFTSHQHPHSGLCLGLSPALGWNSAGFCSSLLSGNQMQGIPPPEPSPTPRSYISPQEGPRVNSHGVNTCVLTCTCHRSCRTKDASVTPLHADPGVSSAPSSRAPRAHRDPCWPHPREGPGPWGRTAPTGRFFSFSPTPLGTVRLLRDWGLSSLHPPMPGMGSGKSHV